MNLSTYSTIAEVVRGTILETHREDSCIASVRVLGEVLRLGFGINLTPRAVTATVYNPYVSAKIDAGEITTTEELIAAVQTPQGWSVGIGYGAQAATNPNKWAGHLVGISKHPEGIVLWDPSLDQATRFHKNMTLKPLVELVPTDPYEGDQLVLRMNECAVIYAPKPETEHIVELSPDWNNRLRFKKHIITSLERLDAKGLLQ